jgi:hypothetical protein
MKTISKDLFRQGFVFLYERKVQQYLLIALDHPRSLLANGRRVAIYVTQSLLSQQTNLLSIRPQGHGIKLELILMVKIIMIFLEVLFHYPAMEL